MNPRKRTTLSVFAAISAAVALSGCGGSGTFSPAITGVAQPLNVTVTVNPPDPTITTGTQQQFTATVTGTPNTRVIWSVSANGQGSPGTITSTGLYTAPNFLPLRGAKRPGTRQAPGDGNFATVTITATSVADPEATGSASATIQQANVIVSVTPQGRTIDTGETLQYTATVTGTTNTAVTWSVSSSSTDDPGSISFTGLYQAPQNIPKRNRSKTPGDTQPVTVTITATSVADPNSFGTASVTLEVG